MINMRAKGVFWIAPALALAFFVLFLSAGTTASAAPVIPRIGIEMEPAQTPQDIGLSLRILFILTVLSLAPGILVMMTSFTRIVIVLSFVRSALATQQMPPNQVMIGLALFLTLFYDTGYCRHKRECVPALHV
jgi:flagellar biosynthetic protein FliP